MTSFLSLGYCNDFTFVPLRVSCALFSSTTFFVVLWYVGAQLDGVISCSTALPSHDISRILLFAHMTYSVAGRVFTTVFHFSLAHFALSLTAFCSTSLVVPVIVVAVNRQEPLMPTAILSQTILQAVVLGSQIGLKHLRFSQTRLSRTAVHAMPGQMIECSIRPSNLSLRLLSWMRGRRSMGLNCAGLFSNTSQSPFGQRMLQLALGSQLRRIARV